MKLLVVLAWVILTASFYLMFRLMPETMSIDAKIVTGITVANIVIVIGAIGSGYLWK